MRCGSKGDEGGVIDSYLVGAPVRPSVDALAGCSATGNSSHQYRVAARLSDMTMCVYMRSAVSHCWIGPKAVCAHSTLLKKDTWSVCGRASVQSWVVPLPIIVARPGGSEDIESELRSW